MADRRESSKQDIRSCPGKGRQEATSRTVAGAAIRGDPGWKRLQEKKEEKKVLYGRRLQRLDDSRLAKRITAKMKECGGVSYRFSAGNYGRRESTVSTPGTASTWMTGVICAYNTVITCVARCLTVDTHTRVAAVPVNHAVIFAKWNGRFFFFTTYC